MNRKLRYVIEWDPVHQEWAPKTLTLDRTLQIAEEQAVELMHDLWKEESVGQEAINDHMDTRPRVRAGGLKSYSFGNIPIPS